MTYRKREIQRQEVRRHKCNDANSARRAQHRAWIRLYANLHYIVRLLIRFGVPARDAADVAHDVFLDVGLKIDVFDSKRPAEPWLYGFAVRHARNYRSLARYSREELCAEISGSSTTMGRSPEEIVLARDEWKHTVEKLARIHDPQLTTILRMHAIDGLTMPEITRELEIPLNTGYSRLRRARNVLCRHSAVLRDVA